MISKKISWAGPCHGPFDTIISKWSVSVEKIEEVFVNILERVIRQINSFLTHKDRLWAYKASVPSIIKTLNKILIWKRFIQRNYIWLVVWKTCWTHYRTVSIIFKQRREKLQNSPLITECTHNINTAAYMEKSLK